MANFREHQQKLENTHARMHARMHKRTSERTHAHTHTRARALVQTHDINFLSSYILGAFNKRSRQINRTKEPHHGVTKYTGVPCPSIEVVKYSVPLMVVVSVTSSP